MLSGVYEIVHTTTQRSYIGSSVHIPTRWRRHKVALNRGVHHSTYLQNTWRKYGEQAFTFKVLVICDVKTSRLYEQRLLDSVKPVFNMSCSAVSPVRTGQKLPREWANKVANSVRARYQQGFKVAHPPRSTALRLLIGQTSKNKWADSETRYKIQAAIRAAMTPLELAARSARTKALWADPEYRANAIAARKGKAYNKGYKCTPEQVKNRQRAARISNIKRNYGADWKQEYIRRYPEHIGDLDA